MPTLGITGKPTASWHGYGGSSTVNQEAEQLTMPKGGTINSVGCWIGGWDGTCDVWLTIWDAAGTRAKLGQSAILTVANEGAPGDGKVKLYVADLLVPVDLPTGADFLVGFVRKQGDAHQVSTGSGSTHRHGRSGATVQGAGFAQGGIFSSEAQRIGAYVADYQPRSGAWIYRAGVWVQSDQLLVYRSGQWVEADTVSAYRAGAWSEAD